MWGKIKNVLLIHKVDMLIALVIGLTVLAAFQMGRLSILYSDTSDFRIIDTKSL